MNRKTMETLILVLGTVVVGAALTLILTGGEDPNRALYTNITFAVGFLFYIIYNMVSTSGLQGKIKDLEGHVAGLKQELANTKEKLTQSESENQNLQKELKAKDGKIDKLREESSQLEKTIKELKEAAAEKK